jgi:hypothetical protein
VSSFLSEKLNETPHDGKMKYRIGFGEGKRFYLRYSRGEKVVLSTPAYFQT